MKISVEQINDGTGLIINDVKDVSIQLPNPRAGATDVPQVALVGKIKKAIEFLTTDELQSVHSIVAKEIIKRAAA